jgi:hypothetical protein
MAPITNLSCGYGIGVIPIAGTAILQEAAMRMAWTRFWLPIFMQNNKRAKAGRQDI